MSFLIKGFHMTNEIAVYKTNDGLGYAQTRDDELVDFLHFTGYSKVDESYINKIRVKISQISPEIRKDLKIVNGLDAEKYFKDKDVVATELSKSEYENLRKEILEELK
jgi:hypothetical protein